MLFNSIEFLIFLPLVFALYWFVKNNLSTQNTILLLASYVFYGWWDLRFLGLLIIISALNYFIGIGIENEKNLKKKLSLWFISGIIINVGLLAVFKYFNFFIQGFIDLFSIFNYSLPVSTTKIILPLGISFYTFLSLSYLIDIKKNNTSACRNLTQVLLSLSFFPIILAGPIHRPSYLLPQIQSRRIFDYNLMISGLKQILWGLFTKIVIADNLAEFSDELFGNYTSYPGSSLVVGVVFYSVQIYADFAGYSDIAIGVARLFGFEIIRNFSYPYFSRDISEFWKKWHISLTTWFRDYIFLPLSFNLAWKINRERIAFLKKDFFIYVVASLVTWSLTGLWHGANYTFIIWGLIHGTFLILYKWQIKGRKRLFNNLNWDNNNPFLSSVETLITLIIISSGWIFFRAESLPHAVNYISIIVSKSIFSIPDFPNMLKAIPLTLIITFFFIAEWIGKHEKFAIAGIESKCGRVGKYLIYYSLILLIVLFGAEGQQYIYFQF